MRKLMTACGAGMLIGALAAVAPAAAESPVAVSARSLKPGTPKHPRGVKLVWDYGLTGLPAAEQPQTVRFDVWFPRGSLYNGRKYPKCSKTKLARRGPSHCPRRSIMGRGRGSAFADTVITHPRITIVNGGRRRIYFYTVLDNPARVQEPVVGHLERVRGKFRYHLRVTIPQDLRIVAGVPIKLTHLHMTAGRGDWMALTGAPAGIRVVTSYLDGSKSSYLIWVRNT